MKNLEQDKLDVTRKERSNMFDWRGQFTPDFIEYMLSCFSKPGMTIADPFLGSGTVLLESIRKGLPCIGYELNPSAFFMSKFFEYAKLDKEKRGVLLSRFDSLIDTLLSSYSKDLPVYTKSDDYRVSYCHLLSFAKDVKNNSTKADWPFLINVLFLCEKDKKKSLYDSIRGNYAIMKNNLLSLPVAANKVEVYLGDARSLGGAFPQSIDLILTSPPYINVFNYHQNYRGIIECFDFDVLKVAESEFGSNRKNRTNRFRTVVQYTMDMGDTILSASKSLVVNGRIVLVVGRVSKVRNTPFYNSKIIESIIEIIPELKIEGRSERQFMNRFGEIIVEDIIIATKVSPSESNLSSSVFKELGLQQISDAISYADSSVKEELMDVIVNSDKIHVSPLNQ